jgi:translation initiation factor IF-1
MPRVRRADSDCFSRALPRVRPSRPDTRTSHQPRRTFDRKIHPHSRSTSNKYWLWLSPRVVFSLLFAFGAAGFFLEHLLPTAAVVVIALLLAVAFERWLVQPIWRVLFGFASHPARLLESAVLEEAEAVTNFNRQGHGLVALNLDGQLVQLLARLADRDRASGCRIRTGDRVSIIAVDSRRNRCTVTRLPVSSMSTTTP